MLYMDTRKNLIIDNLTGKIITKDVSFCEYNYAANSIEISFNTGKKYSYSLQRVLWLKNPKVYDPSLYQLKYEGKDVFNVSAIYVFQYKNVKKYWHVFFENGAEHDYDESYLDITKSCLDNPTAKCVLDYLIKVSNEVSIKTEDGTKLLSKQYEKTKNFVDSNTLLAPYLNPELFIDKNEKESSPIFPFGCNSSQFKAVKAALDNRISVIQGPPGTGKTQTILNIVANLLIAGKTVQVVSNNNSATANVLEKLSANAVGLDFLVAPLGREENKKAFIENQTGVYPDFSAWKTADPEKDADKDDLGVNYAALLSLFSVQERLAKAKREYENIKTEFHHFVYYSKESCASFDLKPRKTLRAKQLMSFWQKCFDLEEREKKIKGLFKLKCVFSFGFANRKLFNRSISDIISKIQELYYITKTKELTEEIQSLESALSAQNADELIKESARVSMQRLRSVLLQRYGKRASRRVFTEEDFWKNHTSIQAEYPIVLSTTFSARSSLCAKAVFDYVIIDEASQVDVATGALAISSARNAVIVGDAKQLPNVVSGDIAKRTNAIFDSYSISSSYCFARKSFLQSICELFPTAPQTLLKEHYRCHPKIIEFCNQKFYGGELVIMSSDHGEKDVLTVIKTVKGEHARDHMNLRQIECIKEEVLPAVSSRDEDIGIIAPYNAQVNELKKALAESNIDIATVHKFQGREKDVIVLTTVDNIITEFTDDPYLLNVAISRAKKQLYVIVSGNDLPSDSNMADLISYIEYKNFSISESRIYSVFDYLYSQYTESRFKYLSEHKRVSEFDSENLMYALIQNVLNDLKLSSYNAICHFPLRMLIRDAALLNDDECRYLMNPATHLDFLIFNTVSKSPVLAIEVDGFHYHKQGTAQYSRDRMKDRILELYGIPFIRFPTNGSGEREKLTGKLKSLL